MTRLTRTELPTFDKVDLAAAAITNRGEYGTVTDLSRLYGVSRPTVYEAKTTAEELLVRHFGGKITNATYMLVDDAQLKRAIVTLRAIAPNSLRAIEDVLPILYPPVDTPSYGIIQQIVVEAEKNAANFNVNSDLSRIHIGALDEMFSQGDPVFAGVDLETGYLFTLSLEEHRGGDDWEKILAQGKDQGLVLEIVVKDAARGIADGVNRIFPGAEQRDDCFHAHYEMGKRRLILERRAYGAMAREIEAQEKLDKAQREGGNTLNELDANLQAAKQKCLSAMATHDTFEQAMREVQEAMEFVDLQTGQIRTALGMRTAIESAANKMRTMSDEQCSKVGTYIFNRAPGLSLYMNEIAQQFDTLAAMRGVETSCLAAIIWRLVDDLRKGRRPWSRSEDEKHLIGAYHRFRQVAGKHADEIFAGVDAILKKRFRASSAIEGFNAALRPHLYVHKGASQGFLDLFRAHFNLRKRRWGARKGTSAHECLTGNHVEDWLSLLGFPPSKTLH